MNEKLDSQLCENYPKIFKNRRASMQQTAMCWGFEHSDGWYNIIDKLCLNIQYYIDTTRERRAYAIRFNRALKQAITNNNLKPFVKLYSKNVTEFHQLGKWAQEQILEDIEKAAYKDVPKACPQVVAQQVKEKFGTLRFYTFGGDEVIFGMIRLAESMSSVTCETCGAPGKRRGNGWIYTSCDAHSKEETED